MQIPSVGRDCHYVARGSLDGFYPPVCRAAKMTEINGLKVSLIVFNPTGIHLHQDTVHDEGDKAPGTWHWPERV